MNHLHVLIVDDSLTVRMDLHDAFGAAGHAATFCATVAEARQALAERSFDLIVLDVLFPDGDGLEFLQELKGNHATADIPVMLLSSEAEVRDRIRGLRTGADEYVGKPYEKSYVIARAEELAAMKASAPAERALPLVLVIDDSITFREELRSALESGGYAVRLAETGEEGLRLAGQLCPNAVVIDGKLPGIDGATVARRLKSDAVLRHTPSLLLTASEEMGDEVRSLEAGADAYVRKGDGAEVILARLAAMLRTATAAPSLKAEKSLFGPKKILAVDDSPTYLDSLMQSLKEEEYDVIPARSGEEALELLAVQAVDCILLDLVMPGLPGQETCRRIKAAPAWRDIPLLMLTAREDREAIIDGFNAGADDFIPKSSEFEVLKARLRAQLRRKQFEDENQHIRAELLKKEVEAAEARSSRELAETRARLLQELERANKELEAFTYSVSHDLRAPLRAIDGFARILLKEFAPQLPPEAQRFLQKVRDNAQQMDQLIQDLLAFSRLSRQPLQKQTVTPADLVRRTLDELRGEQEGRRVEIAIAALPACQADPRLLAQVFVNLLANALKYTRAREVARIEVGCLYQPDRPNDPVYFVKDNGVGFDMQFAHKLFGVFQRLHRAEEYEGTGVGLAIVQRIVLRHGGRVWAEAKLDQGATFYFTLGEENAHD